MKFKISLLAVILTLSTIDNIFADDDEDSRITDPLFHYSISCYFTFANCMLLTNINPDMKLPVKYTFGVVTGLIPGFLKEGIDELSGSNFWDWRDIGYDSAGVVSGIVLHYFIFDKPYFKNKSVSINYFDNSVVASYSLRF